MIKKLNTQGLLANQPPTDLTPDQLIEITRQRIAIAKDAKTLSKKDFVAKYPSLTKEQKHGYSLGANASSEDMYNEAKDNWDESFLTNKIKGYQVKAEKEKTALEQLNTQAGVAAGSLKGHLGNLNKQKEAQAVFAKQYPNYNPSTFKPVDYTQAYAQGVTKEAQDRIKTQSDIPIEGMPKETATCINGVCTLAAHQGVDFSNMKKAGASTVTDKEGNVIPVQNASFLKNISQSGYHQVPYTERQAGDMVQYDENNNPEHMELLLGSDKNNIKTFNNYSLTNEKGTPGAGLSERTLVPTAEGKVEAQSNRGKFNNSRIFRINPETAEAAYLKIHPEYKATLDQKAAYESSPTFKTDQFCN